MPSVGVFSDSENRGSMAESKSKCVISEVILKSNKLQPIIVSFQNGELLPKEASNLRCGIYREKYHGKRRVVAVASKKNYIYKGSSPSVDDILCRTLIAVRNKKTNKVRLIEADSIQLTPELLSSKSEKDAEELDNVQDRSNSQKYSDLVKSFGSKRRKRQTELRERMQFDVNSLSEQLSQTVSNVALDDNLTIPSDNDLYSFIPCNRNAETVDDVYQLNNLITSIELDSLQGEAEYLLEDVTRCQMETTRPASFGDKAVGHIIILGLIANDFSMKLEPLIQSIRMSGNRVVELSQMVGAVSVGKDKREILLKLPLPPPRKPPVKKNR